MRKILLIAAVFSAALALTACKEAPPDAADAPAEVTGEALSSETKAQIDAMTGIELVAYLKQSPDEVGHDYADTRLSSMISPGMDTELLAAAKSLDSNTSTSGRKAFSLRL